MKQIELGNKLIEFISINTSYGTTFDLVLDRETYENKLGSNLNIHTLDSLSLKLYERFNNTFNITMKFPLIKSQDLKKIGESFIKLAERLDEANRG